MRRPGRPRLRASRPAAALLFALVALLAALVGALVPAKHLRTRVTWPSRTLSRAHPAQLWYTPLLVARHEPAAISVRVPCKPGPALAQAPRAPTVVATARKPDSAGALAVVELRRQLRVSVGATVLARLAVAEHGTNCAYRVDIASGRWTISGGPQSAALGGSTAMPLVDGLFSNLDLAAGNAPSVELTTVVHGSRATTAQAVLRIFAVLAALAALFVVATAGRRPRLPRVRVRVGALNFVDAVVAGALLVWWVIGPAYFDDGWIMASQKNFAASSSYSTYYDSFGASSSLQYWLSWLEHGLYTSTSSLLLLRIPALVALAATWALCRWSLEHIAPARTRAGLWALACAFLVGAFAWGMTLRPEPVVALLVTGVFACTVRFLERRTTAPVAIAAVLVVLAASAHPAGAVAIAPLIVAAPQLLAWARGRWIVVATIVTTVLALVATLVVLGSDAQQLHATTTSLRAYGAETAGWRDELSRYGLLSRPLYGAPLRRAWVALALLIVLAYLLRRRRARVDALLGLPAASLGVSLLLLIATPAKLPWHFGTLIGIAALGAAAETTRLAEDATESRWHPRPFVVLGAAMLAAAWAWYPRNTWSDLDLRTLHWTLGFERRLTLAKVAGSLPVLVLAVLVVVELARRRRSTLARAPWTAALLAIPVVAVPLLVFTTVVLAADTSKTKSWTLGRQNLRTLSGNSRCGLANEALVPVRGSMHALAPMRAGRRATAPAWLPPPPAAGLEPFALGPAAARSPWFVLRPGTRFGFFSTAVAGSGTVRLEWGRRTGASATPVGTSGVATYADDARPDITYWRFYAAANLPAPPAGANAVRFVVDSTAQIGLTPPATYADESLATLLERAKSSLALPNLRAYFPCLVQPRLGGLAQVPNVLLAFRNSTWPVGTGTSPFDEVPEVYSLIRMPLSDSPDPPDDVVVYEVDGSVAGAALAPPVVRTAG